jgi:DNA damage-binding protein 1
MQVNYIAGFTTKCFPDSLAIVKPGGMAIGTMDSIQRLHVRTVPLNEQPRRIVHQASSRTFLVGITAALLGT